MIFFHIENTNKQDFNYKYNLIRFVGYSLKIFNTNNFRVIFKVKLYVMKFFMIESEAG
jgi:hypothetical protein